ncbi:hypothetical protein ES703_109199 [subsurface metagenome]
MLSCIYGINRHLSMPVIRSRDDHRIYITAFEHFLIMTVAFGSFQQSGTYCLSDIILGGGNPPLSPDIKHITDSCQYDIQVFLVQKSLQPFIQFVFPDILFLPLYPVRMSETSRMRQSLSPAAKTDYPQPYERPGLFERCLR